MHPQWTYNSSPWVIFDLDGTLADITHRLHYIKAPEFDAKTMTPFDVDRIVDFKPNWDSFNMACLGDSLKNDIYNLLLTVQHIGKRVAIFSGRSELAKERTVEWLKRCGIKYDLLCMRQPKDYRSDTEIKKEMFEKHFNKKDIWFIVDDRDKVVNMWRELGLTCLQCQKGDY